jgi:hypothetical protein
MTAVERARRARATLLGALAASALLHAAAAFALVLGAAALLDAAAPASLPIRKAVLPLAVLGAVAASAFRLWRGRGALGLTGVALFLEDQIPGLHYALVTAVEPAGRRDAALLDRAVERSWSPAALQAPIRRALVPPLLLGLMLLGLLLVLPRAALTRILDPRAGDALLAPRGPGAPASRLTPLVVVVIPPAYARLPTQTFEEPLSVRALVGSTIRLRGRGAALAAAESLRVETPGGAVPPTMVADTWSVSLRMPGEARVVRLTDRGSSRLLTLEPVIDAPPAVELRAPEHDTTYALPRGTIAVEATASDDIGIARIWIELMLTTGGGERFSTTTRSLAALSPGAAGTAGTSVTIRLDSMRLGPGDVMNLRAAARDGNTVTGPGEGSSETRTIRIHDPSLANTIPIVPASVAALDTTVLSQRMLIIRAETLLVRRRRMPADSFRVQSLRLGERQLMLYDRVQALILELETATDVGFVGETEESKLLRLAGVAMRRAEDQLRRIRVAEALPEMYRALDALDKGRTSRRIYLRGMLPRIVVDLDQVRLKGTDSAWAGPRPARPPLADPRRALLIRLDRIVSGAGSGALADSLTMLRAAALTIAPDAAPSLARALEAIRAGADPSAALRVTRRALDRATEAEPVLSPWRGGP